MRAQIEDPIRWKIDGWEQVFPENFREIEAAARISQLADVLGEAMDRAAMEEGLINQGDYQVLAMLRIADHRGESMTATEVARELDMTTATMVNRVDRLEKLGHVERVPHPIDRRAAYLSITESGVACAEQVVRRRTMERKRRLAVLTEDERATLTALMRKLATAWA